MEKALSREEICRYRQRLLDDFSEHAGDVEAVEKGALESSGGARFQDADEGTEEACLAADLTALAVEDELGYEAHEALLRIASGTFGKCETCGRTIARQRLDLVPHARLCAACARSGGG